VAKRVKAPFLGDHDRNQKILVQLPPSSHTLLQRPWIRRFTSLFGGFKQAAN